MKRLANGQKTTVLIPVIVEPVEVEVTLRAIPVEVRHVTIAVGINPRRAVKIIRYRLCHRPLNTLGAVFYSGMLSH